MYSSRDDFSGQILRLNDHSELGNTEIEIQEQRLEKPPKKERLLCLDVLRGLTMMGMIMVDSVGSGNYVIWPLRESDWGGLSTADCVFPSFLFIMGLAIPLSVKPSQKSDGKVWFRVVKRFVLLFLIGMILNMQSRIPTLFTNFNGFRVMGILQRLGLCYLIITSSYLISGGKPLVLAAIQVSFFAIYLGFMYGYPVPPQVINGLLTPCGRGNFESYYPGASCNFSGYLDRMMFVHGKYYYTLRPTDPEDLFTTFSATFNTLCGLFFCLIMNKVKSDKKELLRRWSLFSFFLLSVGLYVAYWEPPIKKIWTVSFAFITSGFTGIVLTLLYFLIDIMDLRILKDYVVQPFVWLGMNPLFIFVFMDFIEILLMRNIQFSYNGIVNCSAWNWIFIQMNSPIDAPEFVSAAISFIMFLFLTGIAYILFRYKIFIKL